MLEEALDPRNPPLERLAFLSIFSTNLDEFMMVRYAGLKDQVAAGVDAVGPDGLEPREVMVRIAARLRALIPRHRRALREEVLPELARRGVELVPFASLAGRDLAAVEAFFRDEALPALAPLPVGSAGPFPRLPNLAFSLLVELRDPAGAATDPAGDATDLAVVQLPDSLPRFLRLPGQAHRYVLLEEILAARLGELFPGRELVAAHGLRITRDAELALRDEEADDLLATIEDRVRRRPWADAVRLEVMASTPPELRRFLQTRLGLEDDDVYQIPNHLDVGAFMELARLDLPELRFPRFQPRLPRALLREAGAFAAVRAGDVLLHQPYDSFGALLRLLSEAAEDPDVTAIAQTLYRVGSRSPVVAALMRAARNGKRVTVVVEVTARFDEEKNIGWARELERAGARVAYGLRGLKTHAKALLIERREPSAGGGVRRYVHLGSGNYNQATSVAYTDLALLSCDPELGADVADLFDYLTGSARRPSWRKLWVAPHTLRERVVAAIRGEAREAAAGRGGRVIAKLNALVDEQVILELYEAARAGVEVDLIVRGICCLRPGVPGVSENIRVRSLVGRFLEHSRALWFGAGGAGRAFIGSADWMPRNFDHRVELMAPVEDPDLAGQVRELLELWLRDDVKARVLLPDGSYARVREDGRLDSQELLLRGRP